MPALPSIRCSASRRKISTSNRSHRSCGAVSHGRESWTCELPPVRPVPMSHGQKDPVLCSPLPRLADTPSLRRATALRKLPAKEDGPERSQRLALVEGTGQAHHLPCQLDRDAVVLQAVRRQSAYPGNGIAHGAIRHFAFLFDKAAAQMAIAAPVADLHEGKGLMAPHRPGARIDTLGISKGGLVVLAKLRVFLRQAKQQAPIGPSAIAPARSEGCAVVRFRRRSTSARSAKKSPSSGTASSARSRYQRAIVHCLAAKQSAMQCRYQATVWAGEPSCARERNPCPHGRTGPQWRRRAPAVHRVSRRPAQADRAFARRSIGSIASAANGTSSCSASRAGVAVFGIAGIAVIGAGRRAFEGVQLAAAPLPLSWRQRHDRVTGSHLQPRADLEPQFQPVRLALQGCWHRPAPRAAVGRRGQKRTAFGREAGREHGAALQERRAEAPLRGPIPEPGMPSAQAVRMSRPSGSGLKATTLTRRGCSVGARSDGRSSHPTVAQCHRCCRPARFCHPG